MPIAPDFGANNNNETMPALLGGGGGRRRISMDESTANGIGGISPESGGWAAQQNKGSVVGGVQMRGRGGSMCESKRAQGLRQNTSGSPDKKNIYILFSHFALIR